MIRARLAVFTVVLLALPATGCTGVPDPRALALVRANDNRTPAGRLRGDTLTIYLEIRMADWRPEADSGPTVTVAAFAEAGKPPQIPAPLIRVRTGTVITATVRNALPDSTIRLQGFLTRPADAGDSLEVRPGESRTITFAAGEPGTYWYRAVIGNQSVEREQAAGALVIDPAEGSPPDRILVLNIWGGMLDSTTYQNALAINGRSWPHTERIQARVGDTLRWRVLNTTWREHPMHLHGFYFTVDAHGNGLRDSTYSADRRRLAVTEDMREFQTMDMTWIPERPGNWLFHCHIGFHVVPDTRLFPPESDSHDRMAHDPDVHMAGLVLGIAVSPSRTWREPVRSEPRRLRLHVQEGKRRGRAPRAMSYLLQQGDAVPASDSLGRPSSLLVLTRAEPTDITVLNHLSETAAIHWHGIELESYSDGVAGWSGSGSTLAPSIQPGDSFTARLTLPRAGTFMYHTHMNDLEQLTSGLYGPLVVLEPGERFDPSRDHVYIAGWDGPEGRLLINGDSIAPILRLAARVPHRFRFINIGAAGRIRVILQQGSSTVAWRAAAKDGADLPASQAALKPASQPLNVGETADYEWTPEPGRYALVIRQGRDISWTQRIVVR